MSQSQKLRSEALDLHERAKTIFDKANATEAELKEFDGLCAKRDAMLAQAAAIDAREDRLNAFEAAAAASDPRERDQSLPHNNRRNVGARHGYSLLKAFRESDPSAKHERLSGLELEVHQELQKRHPRKAKSCLIPWDLDVDFRASNRFRRATGVERRDLNLTTGAGAVHEVVSTSMIEMLRSMMLLRSLGARVITDLNGNFSLPRQTGAGSAYWVTEGNAPTESQQAIGSVDFSPSTLGAFTEYTRAFLNQTSVDAEMFIREDLARVIAIEMDRVGINGSGSGAEPEGLIPNTNVNVVALGTDGAALTWTKLVEMESSLDIANAMTGDINFLASPKARGKMKTTTKVASSTFGDWLWERDNTVNGYPAFSTNQVPATLAKGSGTNLSACLLGDFSQIIYGMWGQLDTLIDPYSLGTSGGIRIVLLQDADFQVRQPKAFTVIKDFVTT